jgi:hypothetical protein
LIRKSEIREEKPRPCITGFGEGNEKNIIRENEQTPAGTMQSQSTFDPGHHMLDQPRLFTFSPI